MKLGTNVSLSLQTAKQPMPNSTLAICRVMCITRCILYSFFCYSKKIPTFAGRNVEVSIANKGLLITQILVVVMRGVEPHFKPQQP